MNDLEEYMYRHDLDEEKVVRILKGLEGNYIDENKFCFEIDGDTAYIESKGKAKLEIVNQDLEKGFIEIKISKNSRKRNRK